MPSRELRVEIVGDSSSLQKAFGKAEGSSSKLARGFLTVGKAAAVAGVALGAGLAVGAKKAIDAASDLNEQIAKTGVVFGDNAKDVHKWSAELSQSFGLSQRAALEAAGTFGNMLVPMGFSRKEAAGMSKQFVELAADMASFNNASPADTLDALRAGLAGETEPLRRFGVFLNDARIKAQALEMGLYSGKGALDAQAKAAATAAIIMKDTADTQGDFARTSDSLANQQRILKAELENSAAAIGQALLPAAVALLGLINQIIPVVTEWGVKLAEAVGPHIEAGILAIAPAFENVKAAALGLLDAARQLLPMLQSIGSVVLGVGLNTFAQSIGAAAIAMYGFHAAAVRVTAALEAVRTAAAGAAFASLLNPLTLITAAVGVLAFAFYRSQAASDAATSSFDRQRNALLALKDAATESANAQQRLREANITLKQAALDISTALQRRNALERDGKKGTDEYKQALIDVERAYSNRNRAELDAKKASDEVAKSTKNARDQIRALGQEQENARQKAELASEALFRFNKQTGDVGSKVRGAAIVKDFVTDMTNLAARADRVAANLQQANPQLATAAANFAKNAKAAADYAKRTGEIPPALEQAVTGAGPAGRRVGASFGTGIEKGINAQVGAIAAAAANTVRVAEQAARREAQAKSPSELFAAIGYDIGGGMKAGIERQYAALSDTAKTAVDKMISAAVQAINERRSVFDNAFSSLTSAALAAFDKLSQEFETRTEKKLRLMDEKAAREERQRALREAKMELGAAQAEVQTIGPLGLGASQEEVDRFNQAQERLKAAQAAHQDAVEAIQRASLERQAAQERKDYEQKRERQRYNLEQRLNALRENFLQGELTVQQFNARLIKILDKANVPLNDAAKRFGFAIAAGLRDAFDDVRRAARALAQEIQDAIGSLSIHVAIGVSRSDAPDHRQHGGTVLRGKPYIVGESGLELFIPNTSGRVISNNQLMGGAALAGGGDTFITLNVEGSVHSEQSLVAAVQTGIANYRRRNGGGFI